MKNIIEKTRTNGIRIEYIEAEINARLHVTDAGESKKMAQYFRNRFKTVAILTFCLGLFFSSTSCTVFVNDNNGKHKGWNKNSNNPHNPNSTNPGKSAAKSEGKNNK